MHQHNSTHVLPFQLSLSTPITSPQFQVKIYYFIPTRNSIYKTGSMGLIKHTSLAKKEAKT